MTFLVGLRPLPSSSTNLGPPTSAEIVVAARRSAASKAAFASDTLSRNSLLRAVLSPSSFQSSSPSTLAANATASSFSRSRRLASGRASVTYASSASATVSSFAANASALSITGRVLANKSSASGAL
ncbi:hypothetical protein [Streptomyces sp. G45]|uniref:hypothetical protein n=1 Tax=Streptomyces sp. G45 TaxID=3406627 RepID=UPI003C18CB59